MSEFQTHLGNSIEIIKSFEDNAFKACITDPPYGVKVDYSLPDYKDSFEEWKTLISAMIPEMVRVCKGPVIITAGSIEAEQFLYSNFPPRWRLCWFKGANASRCAVGFKYFELLFVYGKKVHAWSPDYFYAKS